MTSDHNRGPWDWVGSKVLAFALFFAIFLCLVPTYLFASHPQDSTKRILFIPSYNFDYKGIQWFLQGVMAEFNEQKFFKANLSIENLQLATHPSDRKYMDNLAASLKIKYALEKPDLIIIQYRQALQFMEHYQKEIFGDVPVVFAGLSVEGYIPDKLPSDYTGIVASFSAQKNIELILKNHPATKKIYVVGGIGPVEKNMVTDAIAEGGLYKGKVEFIAVTDMTFPALLEKLGKLEIDSVVMYQALQLDAAGKVFVPAQAASEIAKASRVPVYGMLDTYMGSGVTGGFLIHHEGLGRRAAKIAIDWLQSGVAPEARVKSEPIGSYRFDWRELKRWKVEEDRLPPESKVEFKTFSTWEAYNREIIGGACLFLLQTLLIIGLLWNRSWRIKLEKQLRNNEAKQSAMIANIADVIAIIDKEGINRYKSPNIEKWFGWRPEEVIGVTTWDNVHPEDLERTQKFFGELLTEPNSAGTSECRYRCKDGSYKMIEFKAVNLVHDRDIRGVLLNYHDITARKQAEDKLRETEKEFRDLYESAPVGYHEYDTKGRITNVNKTTLEMLGACKLLKYRL